MTSSIPPNPWFSTINFNESFFKSNTQTITLAYADATYLKRIGIATSVASLTTFSGDVEVNGISTFNDSATFNNTADFNGSLTANGLSQFNNDATFANNVIIGDATSNNITIDGTNITQTNANSALVISSNYSLQLDTTGEILVGNSGAANYMTIDGTDIKINNITGTTLIGDTTGAANGTLITLDEPNNTITLAGDGGVNLVSFNNISLNADLNGSIDIFTAGNIRIGNITNSGAELAINATKTTLKTVNGFQLINNSIQYPSTFYNANQNVSATTFPYALTFNGTSLTATLPTVSSTSAGTQFLITNTNAGNMTVASSSSQLIYFTGSAAATTRTLATGSSHIFTAIRTTSSTTFGWSMV
jgi:hypothetical protein